MESRSAIPKMRRAIWLVLADDLGVIEAKRTVTSSSYFLYMVTILYTADYIDCPRETYRESKVLLK